MSVPSSVLSDTTKVGMGAWYSLHLMARHATTSERKAAFLTMVYVYTEHFICLKCRQHFKGFTVENPPEPYMDEPEGPFYWSYLAHNHASVHAGKAAITYEEARSLYYGEGATCNSSCGGDSPATASDSPESLGYRLASL